MLNQERRLLLPILVGCFWGKWEGGVWGETDKVRSRPRLLTKCGAEPKKSRAPVLWCTRLLMAGAQIEKTGEERRSGPPLSLTWRKCSATLELIKKMKKIIQSKPPSCQPSPESGLLVVMTDLVYVDCKASICFMDPPFPQAVTWSSTIVWQICNVICNANILALKQIFGLITGQTLGSQGINARAKSSQFFALKIKHHFVKHIWIHMFHAMMFYL